MKVRACGLVGAVMWMGLVAGCAGRGPDWKSRIGTMTYDEALLELGPPSNVASLTDGTRVAEWLQYSSRVYSTPGAGLGGWGPYGGWGSPSVGSTPSVYLLLTFAPDGKLLSERRVYR
ncbi:MAG: hypothetical protein JNL10_14185 [Verrucomicrobiales bacterium]|nr:hypothetical protein [Verrucomicrobiales bacterium]